MRTIPAGEFKAKCLAVMAEVNSTGWPAKRGKPLSRVLPMEKTTPRKARRRSLAACVDLSLYPVRRSNPTSRLFHWRSGTTWRKTGRNDPSRFPSIDLAFDGT